VKTIAEHIRDAELWLRTARNFKKLPGTIEILWRLGQAEISLNLAKRQLAQQERRAA
jgi:hypothetical protein